MNVHQGLIIQGNLHTHVKRKSDDQNTYNILFSIPLPEQFRDPDWNDEQMLRKAERIGANTAIVIRRIFDGVKIREQSYNVANAVLKLEKAYDAERLEATCTYTLRSSIHHDTVIYGQFLIKNLKSHRRQKNLRNPDMSGELPITAVSLLRKEVWTDDAGKYKTETVRPEPCRAGDSCGGTGKESAVFRHDLYRTVGSCH